MGSFDKKVITWIFPVLSLKAKSWGVEERVFLFNWSQKICIGRTKKVPASSLLQCIVAISWICQAIFFEEEIRNSHFSFHLCINSSSHMSMTWACSDEQVDLVPMLGRILRRLNTHESLHIMSWTFSHCLMCWDLRSQSRACFFVSIEAPKVLQDRQGFCDKKRTWCEHQSSQIRFHLTLAALRFNTSRDFAFHPLVSCTQSR